MNISAKGIVFLLFIVFLIQVRGDAPNANAANNAAAPNTDKNVKATEPVVIADTQKTGEKEIEEKPLNETEARFYACVMLMYLKTSQDDQKIKETIGKDKKQKESRYGKITAMILDKCLQTIKEPAINEVKEIDECIDH